MIKVAILVGLVVVSLVAAEEHRATENGDEWPECGSEENLHEGEFTPYDYSAVGIMLVVSLGIGVFYGYLVKPKKEDVDPESNDFLLGSGMTIFPVTLSLTTSFITAIELLGNPSEMFFSGTQYSLIVFSALLVIPVAVKLFYPLYYKMNLTSCYEYLGARFDNKLRIFGGVLYILQMSFYTSVAVLAPAIALSKATGLNTHVAVVLIYTVCVFYSSQGGMKAVVIADTFQACVLLISMILVVALGWHYTANPAEVFRIADEYGRIELGNTSPNPTTRHSVFSVIIGGFFYWTSLFCTNQASVQKCMSLKSLKKAKVAVCLAILGLIVVFLFNFYTGLMTFAHYAECDPLRSGQITEKDQLVPFYVMDVFGHIKFMTGIFVAGIFAASLGTVAAALNSMSAVTCEDLLVTGLGWKIPPERGAFYAKWMSLGYGLLSFALVFVVERLGGILQATLTLNGLIGGVTLGLFSLGMFFRPANSKGALYGGILSLALVIFIGIMAQINGEPVVPLPSSLDGCNCTQNQEQQQQQIHYDSYSSVVLSSILGGHDDVDGTGRTILTRFDGPVSMALVAAGSLSTATSGDLGLPAASGSAASMMQIMSRSAEDESPLASVYRISYMWYSFLGMILTVLFGLIISLLTGGLSCSKKQMTLDHHSPRRSTEGGATNLGFCHSDERKLSDHGNGGLPQKSITTDDTNYCGSTGKNSIKIRAGAPMMMMMKTNVSVDEKGSKKEKAPHRKSGSGNGNIFATNDGYQMDENQARTSVGPDSLTMKLERERF
ncbi:LOW QUALITY PROTEIN: sodium-coupled monocarboxylate transporter 1 [Uranotaenia lowii]|uniref:LOW QUALITY PROTEIN: sodium-coupled monocarboxylate transporter 1 n=1 Tax=Uranotaenia lowii TaxID=190385 RepID=UPI00247AEE4B|nr:LOW QUALITY PROTEIN: sodium-coupled monocarboxylate transporter 1 [Uranotaenia lowii]